MEHTNNIPNLNLKLATWNLCLGLSNKKDVVSQTILSNEIDICVLQEIDIPAGYDSNLLSFGGYTLEVEENNVKARTGVYIKNGINYIRKKELEGLNNGLVVIDVKLHYTVRIKILNQNTVFSLLKKSS